jgi:hypothetical protein
MINVFKIFICFVFCFKREEATKKYEIQLQQLITLEELDREKEQKSEDQTKQYQLYKVKIVFIIYRFIKI